MAMKTGQNVPMVVTGEQLQGAVFEFRRKLGKPSLFTIELAAQIIERLANGESFVKIGKDPNMPGQATMYDWERCIPEFGKLTREARQIWSHVANQEALENLKDTPDEAPMSVVKRNEAIAKHTLELTSRINAADYAPKQQIQMDVRSVQIKTTHEKLAEMLRE